MAWFDNYVAPPVATPQAPGGGGSWYSNYQTPAFDVVPKAAQLPDVVPAPAPGGSWFDQYTGTSSAPKPAPIPTVGPVAVAAPAPVSTPAPTAAPKPQPAAPDHTQDIVKLINGMITNDPKAPGAPLVAKAAATPQPAPKPAPTVGDIVNKAIGQVGQAVVGAFKPAPTPQPAQKPSIISQLGNVVTTTAATLLPGGAAIVPAAKKVLSTPQGQQAAKGVGMGLGTLAINLLSGIDDPFGHYKTTSESETDLAKQYGTVQNGGITLKNGVSTDQKPVSHTGDILNDAATGVLGRVLLAGEGINAAFDGAASAVLGKSVTTPALVSSGAKLISHGALALFGLNVVKDTPSYINQIVAAPDPTTKFNLSTQLLGSYLLLAHGGTELAKNVPTTKTIKGTTETVPLSVNDAIKYTNSPNPDLTPQQIAAFDQLYKEGGKAVATAVKQGSAQITKPDVTVPNFYGQLINSVREKLASKQPLTPAEQSVQAAVVVSPQTLVPKPTDLIKDPHTLQTIADMQLQSVKADNTQTPPPTTTLAAFTDPHTGIQQAPSNVIVPGQPQAVPAAIAPPAAQPTTAPAAVAPAATAELSASGSSVSSPRPEPAGSTNHIAALTQAAVQATTPEAFSTQMEKLNPLALRGFTLTDGSVVTGASATADHFDSYQPGSKTPVPVPRAQVLEDFYHQARGEATPPPPSRVIPADPQPRTKSIKGAIKSKQEAQAAVDHIQKTVNAGKSLKKRPSAPAPEKKTGQARLDEIATSVGHDARAFQKENGGVDLVPNREGDAKIRASKNSQFYRDFYKANKKAPTVADYTDEAHSQLKAGKGDILAQQDPKLVKEYQDLHQELHPAKSLEQHEKEMSDMLASIKFKEGDKKAQADGQLRGVADTTRYLQRVRSGRDFQFTTKELSGKAAATFNLQTKTIEAALTSDSKINIMHVGHEVGHEIFNDVLTADERTEFGELAKDQFKGNDREIAHKVAAYDYFDLPEEYQAVLLQGVRDLVAKDQSILPVSIGKDTAEYQIMSDALDTYRKQIAENGQREVNMAIREATPNSRALVKWLSDTAAKLEGKDYSDTVIEEMFSDMNGEYVANRTGSWTDQMKQWFSDLWNGIKKAAGANYDKMQDLFKRSYEGNFKEGLRDTSSNELAPAASKLKLDDTPASDDVEALWEQRFAEAASQVSKEVDEQSAAEREIFGNQLTAERPIPPAFREIKIGEMRELSDAKSTPGNDWSLISKANPATTAKAAVENYDGLLELRKLKAEERIHELFHGITKEQDKELFKGAMAYQVGGETNAKNVLSTDLMRTFNGVTQLFDSVGQDAYASGRIRGVQENYITQIWDKPKNPDTSLTPEQINFLRGASSTSTRFALEKVVKTYNLGIELGLKPKYDRLSDVLREYLLADARAAVGQFFAHDLIELGDEKILATANGLPPGWKAINKISGLRGYSVAPDVWKAIKPLESISAIREKWLGRALVKTSQVTTQVIMAGDFLLLKNYFFDSAKVSSFGAIRALVENANMTDEIRTNLVALGGLKLSEHASPDAPKGKFGKVLKVVMSETKNPYFWADLASFKGGDMLRNGTASMIYKERIKAGDSPAKAAQQAVRFAQDTFGRQNLVRAGRSQTTQDLLRVAMISPDYTESRFKFMGKAFAGATYKIKDREYRRYTAGFLRYLFFAGLLLETLNLATSGHTSDKNDEDHKWDWEIHNADGSKYYVNVLGVVKTDLRFINGISDAAQGNFQTATRFIGNKGSSLERVAQMLITGKDYQGNDIVNANIDSTAQKWEKMGVAAVNNFVPLPIQGFTTPAAQSGNAPKGAGGYVLRTLGFDLYNPKSMPTVARNSLSELETTKQQVTLDVYTLIRKGDISQAQAEIDAFNKTAAATGNRLATLNNLTPTDVQSLKELGTTAAIDSTKLIASAQKSVASGASPDPISKLIDYGVGGTTIASSSSTTGQASAKANAIKAASTRAAKSGGKILKPKKVSTRVKGVKSLKTRKPRIKKAKSLKVRKA